MIGGITRLTQSGLSITEWKPILGIVPPTSGEKWLRVFQKYQETPEFKVKNRDMGLSQFKLIYFWEYLHRLFARLIGVLFLLPFLFFYSKGLFSRMEALKLSSLFFLGGVQGFLGWYMVESGLIHHPDISHYRLAIHLLLAFFIASLTLIFILERIKLPSISTDYKKMSLFFVVFGIILFLQIIYGAFSVGLKAGKIFNTWPLMENKLVPLFVLKNIQFNINRLFTNAGVVQFVHRMLGITIFLMAFILFIKSIFYKKGWSSFERKSTFLFVGIIFLQFIIGIFTLIYSVPIWLALVHQFIALILFLNITFCLYYVLRKVV